jgi:hypothetical protein
MKNGLLLTLVIALVTAFLFTATPALALDDGDKDAKAVEIKDIDRAVRKLRNAICALKNNSSMLTKAKYTLAVNEERERIADMKAELEADGKSSELAHLEKAVANAEVAGSC